jgi:hypothetical protein
VRSFSSALLALSLSAAGLLAVHAPAQARTEAPGATAASSSIVRAKPVAFVAQAPRQVKSSQVFAVKGDLPSSFRGAPVVGEVQVGGKWVTQRSARVARSGSVSVPMQLSEPGKHTIRLRVPGKRSAQSQVLTVTSTGGKPKDASPLRMLSHWMEGGSLPRAVQPRVDEPSPANEVAAATTEQALSFGAIFEKTAEVAGEEVIGFGVEQLLELIFPGTARATEQQIEALQEEVQQGFDNVYNDLDEIQSTLTTVQQQNSQVFSEASLAACKSSLVNAQQNVEAIQTFYANYQNALTPTWGQANLNYAAGTANARVIGNYVFGTGSGTPSFAPGVNALQVQVTNLANAFNPKVSGNALSICADAVAAYVIQSQAPASSSTAPPQVAVGSLDTAYAEQMQNIVAYYTSYISVGAGLVGIGDVLAAATLVSPNLQSQAQFVQACNTLSVFSCQQTQQSLNAANAAVAGIWQATGASWTQVTNGTLAADVYATNADTVFSNGQNAWVVDLASYQDGYFGQGSVGSPLSSTNVDTNSPVSGVSGFASGMSTWAPLTFEPASSEDWNNLLAISSATNAYPGAQGTIPVQCAVGSDNSLTSCQSEEQAGTLMGNAGLGNGGKPVSDQDSLIIYTGENYTWSAQRSGISSGLGIDMPWPSNFNTPDLTVASFLDTGLWPNVGASVVVNDPASMGPANPTGVEQNLTVSDIYPFATGVKPVSGDTAALAAGIVTLQNWSGGYNYVTVPCSTWSPSDYALNGGSWTLMNWIAGQGANGASTSYGSGCGQTSYYPKGGANNTAPAYNLTSTQLADFYAQPTFYAALMNGGLSGPCAASVQNCPTGPYGPQFGSVPGFTLELGGNAVSPAGQEQYLWPVLPLDSTQSCADAAGETSFTQGNTRVNIPQVCQQLYNEWLSVVVGQTVGSVSAFAQPATGLASGNAAQIQFLNSGSSAATMSAVFAVDGGASSTAAPTSTTAGAVSSCTSGSVDGQTTYLCGLSLPPGLTTVTLPVTFSSASATGTLFVGAENAVAGNYTGLTTPIDQSPIAGLVPSGVTNLAATFDVAAASSSSTGGPVTLSWTVPTSPTPVTGYQVTTTGPGGATTTTVPPGSVAAGGTMTTQVTLPQAGYWTFSVAATNAAGIGAADTISITIGNVPPPPPRNFRGLELADGQVALRWQPIVVSPPVNYYTIAWWYGDDTTPPSGLPNIAPGQGGVITAGSGTSLVGIGTTQESVFFVPSLPATGSWTFQIVATNAIGTSTPPVTTMVNMQGFRPSQVLALSPDIGATGRVGASWIPGAVGVPAPTSYTVGLYAPIQCTGDDTCSASALASMSLAAPTTRGPIRVADFFQLGRNSAAGAYTITVTATNVYGSSATARGTVYLTSDFIAQLTTSQQAATGAQGIPASLARLDAQECADGQISGKTPWGTCTNGVWTPAKGTG